MNWKVIGPALLVALALPSLATSQNASNKVADLLQPSATGPSQAGQMYEDIEVMRRLLSGKLQAFAPPSTTHVLASPYAQRALLFATPNDGTFNTLDPIAAYSTFNPNVYSGDANRLLLARTNTDVARKATWLRSIHRPLVVGSTVPSIFAEGTWLKGHGVVFTMTLPPPARDPRPEKPEPAPKPPSDWDRIRKEIRQEKPQAEATGKPAKEPTLSDVLLKVLAENGKNFTQLGPNETLTVVITFRNPEAPAGNAAGVALVDVDNDGYADLFLGTTFDDLSLAAGLDIASAQAQQPQKEDKPAAKPAAEDVNHKKIKDLILLAEMHLKQGKTDEAIKVLRQALDLKPETEQAATANKNLAQALIAVQKYDEAVPALQKAADLLKKAAQTQPKTEPKSTAQPNPLPSKLVISVYKQQLDAVGSGKMSFDAFKKAANVEYLTFPQEKK
ncbi:MAG TPA: tetratricopeptide repeat protein [Gemmataceae bacterium]|nr:tetratricopeptide repeat protein [Gemmataceae bacterium]